ncbi:MAG: hypothetical protein JKY27_07065 [Magnetovibrio sp.]|nr:hypothetical protein [Magnetovibrio sp.]
MSDEEQNATSNNDDTSSSDDSSDDGTGGGTVVTASSIGVNSQILDAVKQSTAAVMDNAATQGAATAYQKVAQAAAFAIQDATDYSRNVENIAMTGQGAIVAKMLEDQSNIPIYTPVLATLQEMVIAASTNMATVGTTATTIATEFPATKS